MPEGRARAVECLCRWREGQIIGLLGGEFTEAIEGARWPVDFAHGFQQQILQGRVKILSHEQSVAGGKQVNVRIGMSRLRSMRPRHNTTCFSPGTVLAMASACATLINRMPGAPSAAASGCHPAVERSPHRFRLRSMRRLPACNRDPRDGWKHPMHQWLLEPAA